MYARDLVLIQYEQYLFPAQAQVISACAELAKRLVSGQGLASEDDKGSVSNWFIFAPKPEAKDPKLTNTLVVVGWVIYIMCPGA
jgi:DNA cross-link repair 1A protein